MTDLDELKRLLKTATPGPWELGKEGSGFWRRGYLPINAPDHHAVFEAVIRMEGDSDNDPQLEANAGLIAALRNAADDLLRDARRYRDLLAAARQAVLALAHVSAYNPRYTRDYERLSDAIDAAIAQEGKE